MIRMIRIGITVSNFRKIINREIQSKFGDLCHISKKFCTSNNSSQNKENLNRQEENKHEYPEIVKMLFENNVKLKKVPCFEVYASQIEILHQPMDFYLAIIVRINIKFFLTIFSSKN